jgi:CRISP-associated protein Cas1
MSEMILVLDRREMVVRLETSVLIIEQPGRIPSKVPLNMIGQMVVIGSPMVSCSVWRELAERKVSVVILPGRGKGEPAYIGAGLSGRIDLRLAQYDTMKDPQKSVEIARFLIRHKIEGQRQNLIRMKNRINRSNDLPAGLEKLGEQLKVAESVPQMMGIEGMAANIFFKGLQLFLPESWEFTGRNRRPPRDPANALMSLGYVLAGSIVRQEILKEGLDPCIGFLHAIQSGRESFVLDILEPIRPMVDSFVLDLTQGPLSPERFSNSKKDGCRLDKEGRKVFFQWWGHFLNPDNEEKTIVDFSKLTLKEVLKILTGKNDDELAQETAPDWL